MYDGLGLNRVPFVRAENQHGRLYCTPCQNISYPNSLQTFNMTGVKDQNLNLSRIIVKGRFKHYLGLLSQVASEHELATRLKNNTLHGIKCIKTAYQYDHQTLNSHIVNSEYKPERRDSHRGTND